MRRATAMLASILLAACEAPREGASGSATMTAASGSAPAAVCGLPDRALGTAIDRAAGYTIHDTAPGSTEPRAHHLTGFRDGCPRVLTAALVLFGDLATHETTLYDIAGGAPSPTDAAYEAIKARVCGVPQGSPCGDRIGRLAQDTAFLSVYPVFGEEAHSDLLLHAGEVVAVD